MKFRIKTEDENIILTAEQVFTHILKQAFTDLEEQKTANLDIYVATVNKGLISSNENILDVSLKQLYTIMFLAGYYYKIFSSKNDIDIIQEK